MCCDYPLTIPTMQAKLLTALGVLGLSMWFNTIATVLHYWWRSDELSTDVGLFKFCGAQNGYGGICTQTVDTDDTRWLQAVQAMLLSATLALSTCIAFISTHVFTKKHGKPIVYIATGLSLLGALLSLTGVIVFASKIAMTFPGGHYMACFGLAIISVILSLVACGVLVFSLMTDTY